MCRARVSGPAFRGISMRKGAGSCPVTRCGSASRRGTMSPPRALTWGEARRSRCGCRASRSCARRPAPRRGTWPPRRTRSPRLSASWGRGRGTWRSSGPARPAAPAVRRTRGTDRFPSRRRSARRPSRASSRRCRSGFRSRDLAQQRSREAGGTRRPADARDGPLPFQATERAQAVAREQEALQQRVQELSRAVEEVTRAAQAAGLGDTAFQARLREVQELLRRAVTPELAVRLRELQEALARLDPEATRRALERLAEAQQLL